MALERILFLGLAIAISIAFINYFNGADTRVEADTRLFLKGIDAIQQLAKP